MTTTITLEEFSGLLAIFKRVVEAGMQANLSASTDKEGNLKAKLEVKFCRAAAPSSLPSKSKVSSPVAEAPGQPAAGRRRKRRGPAARERARARAACYRAAKAAAAAAHVTLILGPLQMCRFGNKERLNFGDLLRVFFVTIHFSDAPVTLRRSSFQK